MEPWLDNALACFDRENRPLVARTAALLERAIAEPALHARLLNTLSLLEHMGSHKIVATQTGRNLDQPTLRHIAEEAHHAFFMKRQAEKASGGPLTYADQELLAAAAARMYFQRLEAAMLRTLSRQRSGQATYLYMSMIVEFRALWFYEIYQQTLRGAGHRLSLKRILGEERNHLQEVAGRLADLHALSDTRTAEFTSRETVLYTRLLKALESAVTVQFRAAQGLRHTGSAAGAWGG